MAAAKLKLHQKVPTTLANLSVGDMFQCRQENTRQVFVKLSAALIKHPKGQPALPVVALTNDQEARDSGHEFGIGVVFFMGYAQAIEPVCNPEISGEVYQ